MKKELKDYLHLYIGCEVIGTYNDASGSRGYLTGITNGGGECEIQFILEDGFNVEEEPYFNNIEDVKPILRPIFDMKDEDQAFFGCDDEYFDYMKKMEHQIIYLHSDEFIYLLSKHFDLFGLIESGLAIDVTTLK